jgi:hypothetical protein
VALTPAPQKIHMAELNDQAESERLAQYDRAWRVYDGEGPKALEAESGEPDDSIRLDYAATIVDKGVSFLAGKGGVEFQLSPPAPSVEPEADPEADPPDPSAAEAAEQALKARAEAAFDEAWPPEQRDLDFQKLATNGGVCGHAWIRLREDGSVSVLDPANVIVEWHEDDVDIVKAYILQWNTVDSETGLGAVRRKVFRPDDPQKPTAWTITDEELDEDSGTWHALGDPTPWRHAFAPMFDCQNLVSPNTYYGKADLSPSILDMLAQLESTLSEMRRILRLQGHKVPTIFGAERSQIEAVEVGIGSMVAIPNAEGHLDELAVAELTSALEFYRELKTAFLEATRIPKVALGETENAGPVAGVALTMEYEPLIEKTETKWLTYGLLLIKLGGAILEMKGFAGWTAKIGWPKLLPADSAAEAQADESELRMGVVSKRTIAEKRGYNWDEEQQRIAEEEPNFDHGEPGLPGSGLVLPEE